MQFAPFAATHLPSLINELFLDLQHHWSLYEPSAHTIPQLDHLKAQVANLATHRLVHVKYNR